MNFGDCISRPHIAWIRGMTDLSARRIRALVQCGAAVTLGMQFERMCD
jgi:hypothetical protein